MKIRRVVVVAATLLSACARRCESGDHPDVAPIIDATHEPDVAMDVVTEEASGVIVVEEHEEEPDACLDILTDFEAHVRAKCTFVHTDHDVELVAKVEKRVDLNGDGKPESLRSFPVDGNGGAIAETHIYLGGAPCATHVATFTHEVQALATKHGGWRDLEYVDGASYCEGCSIDCRPSVTYFIYKDGEYVEDEKRAVKGVNGYCGHEGNACVTNAHCFPPFKCVDGWCRKP